MLSTEQVLSKVEAAYDIEPRAGDADGCERVMVHLRLENYAWINGYTHQVGLERDPSVPQSASAPPQFGQERKFKASRRMSGENEGSPQDDETRISCQDQMEKLNRMQRRASFWLIYQPAAPAVRGGSSRPAMASRRLRSSRIVYTGLFCDS